MIRQVNKKVNISELPTLYPKCRYLVKINGFDEADGIVVAISDSVDSDRAITDMMQDYLSRNILCFIGGDHIHNGIRHVVGTIR